MFAQPWVGVPLYLSPLYPTLCLMGIGAQATVSSLLSMQLELGSTGSSSSFPPLSSWLRNEWGEAERLLVRLETFVPSSGKQTSRWCHHSPHRSSFPHPQESRRTRWSQSIMVPKLAQSYPACVQGRAMLLPWVIPHSGFGLTVFSCGVGAWATR